MGECLVSFGVGWVGWGFLAVGSVALRFTCYLWMGGILNNCYDYVSSQKVTGRTGGICIQVRTVIYLIVTVRSDLRVGLLTAKSISSSHHSNLVECATGLNKNNLKQPRELRPEPRQNHQIGDVRNIASRYLSQLSLP